MENNDLEIANEYLENGLYKNSLDILLKLINNNIINASIIKIILKIYITFKSYIEAKKYVDILILLEPTVDNYYIKFDILKNIENINLLEDFLVSIPKLEIFNNLISEIKCRISKYFNEEFEIIFNDIKINDDTKTKRLINYYENTYLQNLDNYSSLIKESNIENIINDSKKEFRYFCYNYLDLIKKIQLPDIQVDSFKEAVLVEFRQMPHLEFLIRNTIHKLKSEWSHTIVCGNLNYEYMLYKEYTIMISIY
jgi:hypothetical protein